MAEAPSTSPLKGANADLVQYTLDAWHHQHLAVLLMGGQALVRHGVREQSADLDCCVPAAQCPAMLDWLVAQEKAGRAVSLVAGCAPLDARWLEHGWFC